MNRHHVLVAASLLALLLHGGAHAFAAPDTVRYAATDCTETVLLFPARHFSHTAQISVLVYRCDAATIDGEEVSPFLVSEIGVFDLSGQLLLRHVSNSSRLAVKLRALGFPAYFSERMTYRSPTTVGVAQATVPFRSSSFSLQAAVGSSPVPPQTSNATGATYRNRDGDGNPITLAYASSRSDPVPGTAVGFVDASSDPELAAWLAGSMGTGPGIHQRGDWSATGSRDA